MSNTSKLTIQKPLGLGYKDQKRVLVVFMMYCMVYFLDFHTGRQKSFLD